MKIKMGNNSWKFVYLPLKQCRTSFVFDDFFSETVKKANFDIVNSGNPGNPENSRTFVFEIEDLSSPEWFLAEPKLHKSRNLSLISHVYSMSKSRFCICSNDDMTDKLLRSKQIRPLTWVVKIKMARNSESDNYNSNDEDIKRKRQIRLRRFPSTSKVETIVTEDEKLRRAQPDKP